MQPPGADNMHEAAVHELPEERLVQIKMLHAALSPSIELYEIKFYQITSPRRRERRRRNWIETFSFSAHFKSNSHPKVNSRGERKNCAWLNCKWMGGPITGFRVGAGEGWCGVDSVLGDNYISRRCSLESGTQAPRRKSERHTHDWLGTS